MATVISTVVVDDPTADIFQPPADMLAEVWWDSSLGEDVD